MYCRTQLVELQRALPEFEAAGVWVAAISYDPPGALAQFCGEHGITYPFLSDDGSRLIRQLGILNTLIEPDEAIYGIPYPGAYLLDESGVIVAKYFHREYQVREAPSFVLEEGFGLTPSLDGYPATSTGVDGATVEVVLGAPDLKFWQRVNLHVRVTPHEGWTLIDEAVVRVTSTAEVQIKAPRYHAGSGEVRVELLSGLRGGESVHLDVTVSCVLRNSEGASIERTVEVRLDVLVGTMNSARPAGG
ncbi:MAG: redoxin domain-containing protein [Dehalococcoidia bacterium]|nr:redoxin domain-containing protein [Dehalococcoidia bacterium]